MSKEEPVPVVHIHGEDPAGIIETTNQTVQEAPEPARRAAVFLQRLNGHKVEMEFRLDEFERIAVSYNGQELEIDPGLLFGLLNAVRKGDKI